MPFLRNGPRINADPATLQEQLLAPLWWDTKKQHGTWRFQPRWAVQGRFEYILQTCRPTSIYTPKLSAKLSARQCFHKTSFRDAKSLPEKNIGSLLVNYGIDWRVPTLLLTPARTADELLHGPKHTWNLIGSALLIKFKDWMLFSKWTVHIECWHVSAYWSAQVSQDFGPDKGQRSDRLVTGINFRLDPKDHQTGISCIFSKSTFAETFPTMLRKVPIGGFALCFDCVYTCIILYMEPLGLKFCVFILIYIQRTRVLDAIFAEWTENKRWYMAPGDSSRAERCRVTLSTSCKPAVRLLSTLPTWVAGSASTKPLSRTPRVYQKYRVLISECHSCGMDRG